VPHLISDASAGNGLHKVGQSTPRRGADYHCLKHATQLRTTRELRYLITLHCIASGVLNDICSCSRRTPRSLGVPASVTTLASCILVTRLPYCYASSPVQMATLLELSHELLHCIFTEITPTDLSAVSRTCKDLNSYIRGNKLLHKDLYLQRYDQPPSDTNWEIEVHYLSKLEKILQSSDRQVKRDALEFAAEQINYLLDTSSSDPEESLNVNLLAEHFKDAANIDALLCCSTLFEQAGSEDQVPAVTEELRQSSAKLHCMYGVPIDAIPSCASFTILQPSDQSPPSSCTRLRSRPRLTHPYARAKVYDLRQYTEATLWGPFRDDGTQRVDWEKVEAIMVVLGFNLRRFTERSDGRFPMLWDKPFVGAPPNSYIAPATATGPREKLDPDLIKIRNLALSLNALDPYGVTGTWMRVVCFLDFNDLYAFNFAPGLRPDDQRGPINTEEGMLGVQENVCVKPHSFTDALAMCSYPTDPRQVARHEDRTAYRQQSRGR
jgi:hypothetical protein